MKHLKRFNEEFGRDEVVFTSQRNPRLVNIDYEEDEDRPNDYFLINITK